MREKIKNFVFGIYIVIAVIITLLLLSYNDFKVSQIGNYTLLNITDSALAPEFNKGELVIVDKDDEVLVDRKAFFYDVMGEKAEIKLATIVDTERINSSEITYTLEGDRKISSEYIIGPANTADRIQYLGTVLNVLESKWGFLFLIVFPALVLVVNQIGIVCSNIMKALKEEKAENKNENKDENK